jgi:hypothetical protein
MAAVLAAGNKPKKDDVVSEKQLAAVRQKPVRLSVDIEPVPYRRLISWCQDFAGREGRAKINTVWVIRALVEELFSDRGLQGRVEERVRQAELSNK